MFLGHKPNRLAIVTKDERGKIMARDYRKVDEEAAYASWRSRSGSLCALEESAVAGKDRQRDWLTLSSQP